MHAHRIRPDAGALDRRRLVAASLSAVLPGLGQLFNRRPRLGAVFLVPSMVVLLVAILAWTTSSPTRLAATIANPSILDTLLLLNGLLLVFRLASAGQAFIDTRWHGPTSRLGVIGILVIAVLIVVPHLMAHAYGTAFGRTFEAVFRPQDTTEPGVPGSSAKPRPTGPAPQERFNVLLVGVDTQPGVEGNGTLTDTMMVVSLDPVGKTVSMLSLPRDLVRVPLGNGDTYAPKLNSLFAYAERNPDEFPGGGMRALQDAIGALLEIDIHYWGRIDFVGFVRMIDAVGGVDVKVTEGFVDPTYDGYGWGEPGFSVSEGTHHFDGPTALAYARSRKALGESDFTRASRQQQILVALRDAVTKDGSLLWELPALLQVIGETVATDVPIDRLPELATTVDEVGDDDVYRAVLRHPLVRSRTTEYGSSLVPRLGAIREMAAALFSEPGTEPVPWPTPTPTAIP